VFLRAAARRRTRVDEAARDRAALFTDALVEGSWIRRGPRVRAETLTEGYERSDVAETLSALASDSSVSSGGVRWPRSSIEM
jgi:hypothetical protein